jgi:hypothetical protein
LTEQIIRPQQALGDVHLVGSLPFEDAESAFRSAADGLGGRVAGLPDGEPGQRQFWGGWPMVDMTDLGLCVELANAAVAAAHRHLDFIHMPVDVTSDDAFYGPLANLDVGDTKIYLGLVHFHEETSDAFRARVATAQKYLSDFGVAAVCGYGRANPDEAGDIFKMHVECAELLHPHAS